MKRSLLLLFSLALWLSACSETVNTDPVAVLETDGQTRINTPLSFDGSGSFDAETAIRQYEFDFGDGSEPVRGVSRIEHSYAEAGSYIATLTVWDHDDGQASTSVQVLVIDNKAPVASLSGPVLATVGQRVSFDGSSSTDPDGEIVSWALDYGDGSTIGTNPVDSHIYEQPGVYTVSLTVTDNEGATDIVSRSIQIQSGADAATAPLARLSVPGEAHARETLTFDTGESVHPGATAEYKVYFGDGDSAAGRSVTHEYAQGGHYTALLMMVATYPDQSTAVSMDARQIRVHPLNEANTAPVAHISLPASARIDAEVVADASGSTAPGAQSVEYEWDFSDGIPVAGPLQIRTFNTPGNRIVQLTVTATYADGTEAMSQASKVLYIQDNTAPIARLSGPTEGLVSDLLTFDASESTDPDGSITQVELIFADDSGTVLDTEVFAGPDEAVHAYAFVAPGVHRVTARVTDNDGLLATKTILVTVKSHSQSVDKPVAVLNGPSELVVGEAGVFSATESYASDATGVTYHVAYGDGASVDTSVSQHAYIAEGLYTAELRVVAWYADASSNVSQTATAVRVKEGSATYDRPQAAFEMPASIRFDDSLVVDANASMAPGADSVAYAWDFGDGATAAGVVAMHEYAVVSGTFPVTLTVEATYSDATTAYSVTQKIVKLIPNQAPVAKLSAPHSGVENTSLAFDSSDSYDPDGTIVSRVLDFGDGNSSTSSATTHQYAAPGVYNVTLTVTDNDGAIADVVREVRILSEEEAADAPVARLTAPAEAYPKQNVTLDGSASTAETGSIESYYWDLGDGRAAFEGGASINVTYATRGTFDIALRVTNSSGLSHQVVEQITILNTPPTITSVDIGDGYTEDDDIAVKKISGWSDADGDAPQYRYQWYRNGSPLIGQTADTLPNAQVDQGASYYVQVTPYDGFDEGFSVDSNEVQIRLEEDVDTVTLSSDEAGYYATSTILATVAPLSYSAEYEYRWYVNGTLVPGAESATLSSAFAGDDNVRAQARLVEGVHTGNWVASSSVLIVNTPPMIHSVTYQVEPVQSDEDLVVEVDASDADGDPLTYSYVWYVNGTDVYTESDVASATSTLTNTNYDKGDDVYVNVVVNDGDDDSAPVDSAVTTIENSTPVITSVTLSPASVTTSTEITATVVASDADGDTLTYTYTWYVNTVEVFSEINVASDTSTLDSGEFERFDDVNVVVVANDGQDDSASESADTTVQNTPPSEAGITLFPSDYAYGDSLYAELTTAATDPDVDDGNDSLDYHVEWFLDDVLQKDARVSFDATITEVTSAELVAGTWKVVVTPEDDVMATGVTSWAQKSVGGAFTAAATMDDARQSHTATRLPNGSVLVVGGFDGADYLATAQVYYPEFNTYATTVPTLTTARSEHTATLLNDGRVLIAGGFDGTNALDSAQIYDPDTNTFEAEITMDSPRRYNHTATLLDNGTVLLAGGFDGTQFLFTAEIFDPGTSDFTAVTSFMQEGRFFHSAVKLADGRVLIAGGGVSDKSTADIFDPLAPAGDEFSVTGTLNLGRQFHTAVLLSDDTVLIVGGREGGDYRLATERFDPAADTGVGAFVLDADLTTVRTFHTTTVLDSGRVLVTGGRDDTEALDSAEVYYLDTESFVATGSMTAPRQQHTATLLDDGNVFVAGGRADGTTSDSTEVFDPQGL